MTTKPEPTAFDRQALNLYNTISTGDDVDDWAVGAIRDALKAAHVQGLELALEYVPREVFPVPHRAISRRISATQKGKP